MKRRFIILMLSMSILLLPGCSKHIQASSIDETVEAYSNNDVVTEVETEIETEEIVYEPIVETYSLDLLAVGDNLIHSPIYKKAKQSDGTYDFAKMYENVKDTIQSYDVAVINQETIFVSDNKNVSSYPCFGTPDAMGDTLIDIGFDVVLTATNHTWDKGKTGYYDTLEYWSKHPEITVLGINENENDYNTIDVIEKNGFKLAMFNYTYGLNGFSLPSDMSYAVNLLSNKEKFINDLRTIEDDVDFSICFLHIGTEYVYEPTEYQVNYINDLIDAGADIIICAHPHVIEPYTTITTELGNSAIVYYSCGNFISNQDEVPRVLGGMAELRLEKTIVDGNVTCCEVTSYDFIPIVTHYNSTEHTVYLLDDYTEELAKTHKLVAKGLSLQKLKELWSKVV